MKGINLLCSSPASAAIITSSRSSKRHASVRSKSQLRVPCNSSQLIPINPSPYHRKSLADGQNNDLRRKTTVDEVNNLYGSSSTRYLLSDTGTPFIQWISDSDEISAMPIQVF